MGHCQEFSSKVDRLLPAKTQPRNATNQVQLIAKSMTVNSKRIASLPTNNLRPIKPLISKSTEPALAQKVMFANESQPLNNSVQNIQVAKLDIATTQILPIPPHAGHFDNTARQPYSSVEPTRVLETAASFGELLQGTVITKVSTRFYKAPIPGTHIGARSISSKNHFGAISYKPNEKVMREIRTIMNNQIRPVQLGSTSKELIEASNEEELEESLKTATHSDRPINGVGSSGIDLDSQMKGFSSGVWEKIANIKYYPRIAQDQGWEGKPVVEFVLARNGDLLSYTIAVASPYEILNQAAIDAVKNASPYPEIPESFKSNSIRLKLPISFKLD